MNGVSEQDYSEFVEVDPTGRYGRVTTFSYFFLTTSFVCLSFHIWCFIAVFRHVYINLFSKVHSLLFFVCSTMRFLVKGHQRQCMKLSSATLLHFLLKFIQPFDSFFDLVCFSCWVFLVFN